MLGIVRWPPAYLEFVSSEGAVEYLDNVKLSTKDNEEYRGHENL